jgi:superfamily I DNA/RNA helicase
LRVGFGVSGAFKSMPHADSRMQYTRELLVSNFGLLAEGPWFDVLLNISMRKRQYYRSALRRGENLQKRPRIHIDTIHGVKGGEADNVVLCSDLSSRSQEELTRYPDEAHRVFYVGATRAKHNLHLLFPQTAKSYKFM